MNKNTQVIPKFGFEKDKSVPYDLDDFVILFIKLFIKTNQYNTLKMKQKNTQLE